MDTNLLVQVAEEFLIENLPELPDDHVWYLNIQHRPGCRVLADSRCWGTTPALVEN